MAPHSSTFAWKIPWTEELGGPQSMGSLESDTTERLHFHFSLSCIGEGNGNPLHYSCLEDPRDGGAWWAVVYGVAQSRTRLKRLSSSRHASDSPAHPRSSTWTAQCRHSAKFAEKNENGVFQAPLKRKWGLKLKNHSCNKGSNTCSYKIR